MVTSAREVKSLQDCIDHEDRLDRLERRFHEFDGVLKALRIAGLLTGIIISLYTLIQILPR